VSQNNDEAERLNRLSNVIIGAAIRVHDEFGPGMLESAYEAGLAFELSESGLRVERQKALPLTYRGQRLACGYRVDLIVEDAIVIEVKAIERVEKVHKAQVLSYLKQLKLKLGLLVNFNVRWLRDGVTRVVNGFPE
jgi:GxxExxY protein